MKARVSHNGNVIVKTTETLKGKGVKFRGITSDGLNSFILTEKAYSIISNKCVWEK